MQLWPKAAPPKKERIEAQHPEVIAKRNGEKHWWPFFSGRWACRRCLTVAKTDHAKEKRSREKCKGFSPVLADILREERGHKLVALHGALDADLCIFCISCNHAAREIESEQRAPVEIGRCNHCEGQTRKTPVVEEDVDYSGGPAHD